MPINGYLERGWKKKGSVYLFLDLIIILDSTKKTKTKPKTNLAKSP